MGMIIRVAFNNQNWADKCNNADTDDRLFQCQKGIVNVGFATDKSGICRTKCWESTLCSQFYWISTIGNFGERAKGEVFFLFKDTDNSLVLWGKSRVKEVVENEVYFEKFKPLPQERWIRGLSSSDLENLGIPKWLQGTYRYFDDGTVVRINDLLNNDYFDDPAEPFSDLEGRKKLHKHLITERSSRLVKEFKSKLTSYECSICGFDFEKTYGDFGKGFIEAHHKKPVSLLSKNERVSVEDLVAVCSNCHRMLHRKNPPLTIQALKNKLKKAS